MRFFLLPLLLLTSSARAQTPAGLDRLLAAVEYRDYYEHLGVLSGFADFRGRRIPDRFSVEGLALTRTYIKSVLKAAGFAKIHRETFSVDADRRYHRLGRWTNGANYYVEIPGFEHPEQIILVTAHYDSFGLRRPGANDNGSGAAAVLTLAEALRRGDFRPRRTIRLVLLDGEEMGYFGSTHHVRESAYRADQIELMINLDMIGFPGTRHNQVNADLRTSPVAFDHRHLRHELWELLAAAGAAMPAELRIEARPAPRIYRSDHAAGIAFGFPTVGLAERILSAPGHVDKISPHYHTTRDRFTLVNLDYALGVTRFLASLTALAADREDGWTRESDRERRARACLEVLGATVR